jgi:replicative DNA helicase
MTDVAEDFNKIRIADVVISINATDEEKSMKQARLFFAASRNQRSGFTVRVEQEIDRAKFIRKVLGEE